MFRQAPDTGWVPNRSDQLKMLAVNAGCLYLQVRGRLRMLFLDKAVSVWSISYQIKMLQQYFIYAVENFMLWEGLIV